MREEPIEAEVVDPYRSPAPEKRKGLHWAVWFALGVLFCLAGMCAMNVLYFTLL